jgi:membrane protein implicated in regulation of membrane protease activity
MKLTRKEVKPTFWEWILFDKVAFKVIFFMSIILGIVVSVALVALSWAFSWGTEVTIIISILAVLNIWNAVKTLKNLSKMPLDMSINDFVYQGKAKRRKK